jgi:feruloyl esterase
MNLDVDDGPMPDVRAGGSGSKDLSRTKGSRHGAQLYPGLARGSEAFWPNRDPEGPFPIPISHYKWLVFGDPNWDWRTFEFTDANDYRAHRDAETRFAPILNATNPDLREFRKRGGKLLQYHGWNDQLISPQNSIDYYESVLAFFGKNTDNGDASQRVDSFYRLFMAPGMAHCFGGSGPSTFDMQQALENWAERGVAPDRITATRSISGVVDRSRPLCPYPQTSVYLGTGDINEAAYFVCGAAGGRKAAPPLLGQPVVQRRRKVPDVPKVPRVPKVPQGA